jgi:MFS family permease
MGRMTSEERCKIVDWILYIALLIGSIGLLLAVINIGHELATTWLLVFFQILIVFFSVLIVFLSIVVFAVISLWLIREIETRYSEEIKQLKRYTPTFVAGMCLLANSTMVIAGQSFQSDAIKTLVVSLLLLALFGFANYFAISPSVSWRIIGSLLYFLGFLFLPIAALWYHDWNLQWIFQLDLGTQALIGLTFLILFVCFLFLLKFANSSDE